MKVHYHAEYSPSMVPILSLLDPVHFYALHPSSHARFCLPSGSFPSGTSVTLFTLLWCISDFTVTTEELVDDELERMWEETLRPNLRYHSGIYLETLSITTNNFSHNSRSAGLMHIIN
jgi:hypothetical protein